MLKTRFPFSKPSQEVPGKTSPWDSLYNKNQPTGTNNTGGMGGFSNNNNWGGANNWPQTGNNAWGKTNNNQWGNNNNWNSPGGWGNQPMGGMGGIMGGGGNTNNSVSNIAAGQKLVSKQKQTLQQISGLYTRVLDKNQHLDATRQSLEI